MRTFGMDEPMGCYDDIEQADVFVLWGANMAEMHPFWSRITNRRLSLTRTSPWRCFQPTSIVASSWRDNGIIFTPQSDP